jgi:hypothetical protein
LAIVAGEHGRCRREQDATKDTGGHAAKLQ